MSKRRHLLDTHALLWWLSSPKGLSSKARRVLTAGNNTVFVSAAVAWEMSIKRALGRLDFPDELEEALDSQEFQVLPIELAHALGAGDLPLHHGDPFDRMQVAQALLEDLVVITRDSAFDAYGVRVLEA